MIWQYSYDADVSRLVSSIIFLKEKKHVPEKVEKHGLPQHTIGLIM